MIAGVLLISCGLIGGCGPETGVPEEPNVFRGCFVPSELDDVHILSAGISTHEPGPDFLIASPTLPSDLISVPFARVPSEIRTSFVERNEAQTSLSADAYYPLNGDVTQLSYDDVPVYADFRAWDRLLNADYDARYVHLSSMPGYSCDGTRAAVYIEHNCGNLCASGWFYLFANVDGIWVEYFREQIWVS